MFTCLSHLLKSKKSVGIFPFESALLADLRTDDVKCYVKSISY